MRDRLGRTASAWRTADVGRPGRNLPHRNSRQPSKRGRARRVRVGPVPSRWFRHPERPEPPFGANRTTRRGEGPMATERDPYQVLGLSSAASQAEITSAYRRLLRQHPHSPPAHRSCGGRGPAAHLVRLRPPARPRTPRRARPGSHRFGCGRRTRHRPSAPPAVSDPTERADPHPCRFPRSPAAATSTRDRIVGEPGAMAPTLRLGTQVDRMDGRRGRSARKQVKR